MSLGHSPSIVTNGLVLCLDAANSKSYPGTGTTWTDLSGNGNNGTLTGGPTFSSINNGTLVLDGVDDYIAPTGLGDSFWQGNWTASFWVNFDTISTTTNGANDKVLLQHGTSLTRQGLHLDQRNSTILFGLYADDLTATQNVIINTWYNIVFTLNNTTRLKQIYINGILNNSNTGAGSYAGTGNNARICSGVFFGQSLDGFFPSCSFYNTVLTAGQVSQNFNALRGRYGI